MKRSIPRSLVSRVNNPEQLPDTIEDATSAKDTSTPPLRGAGSAWKSGALAQSQAAVEEGRARLAEDILNGRHELSLEPDQITDPLGSDRRTDWMEQEAFTSLLKSIETTGQDTPILVWPEDPGWKPDPLDPVTVNDVPFVLLTGRRRHAAARKLGRRLRAILASPEMRTVGNTQFEMLFLRFRENEARENLGPFERLLSIGEMYETLAASGEKLTAVAFSDRIGVHESIVSRARSVYSARDEILNTFKNVYEMSFRDLQAALAGLDRKPKTKSKTKPKTLTAKRKIGSRNLSLSVASGNLSIKASGVPVDKDQLEELSDLIANFLNRNTGMS